MRPRLESLDRLRGIAVVLMVMNHLGVAVYGGEPARATLSGAAVFLGSFAPVLFFFATGYGAGLRRGPGRLAPVAVRASLLLVADWLLLRRAGYWLGLDFLGFIALSMITLEGLRGLRRGDAVAAALLVVALLGRFVVAPFLSSGASGEPSVTSLALGARPIGGVAYPPLPWVAFPLAGFLAARRKALPSALRSPALALAFVAFALASAWLVASGRPLFRWGTVSIAFFVASGAVLAAMVGWSCAPRAGRVLRPLATGGVASLAVVPLHYLGVGVLGALDLAFPTWTTFAAMAVLLTGLSLAAARGLETLWAMMRPRGRMLSCALPLGLAVVLGVAIEPGGLPSVLAMVTGQLGLCAAMVWIPPAAAKQGVGQVVRPPLAAARTEAP